MHTESLAVSMGENKKRQWERAKSSPVEKNQVGTQQPTVQREVQNSERAPQSGRHPNGLCIGQPACSSGGCAGPQPCWLAAGRRLSAHDTLCVLTGRPHAFAPGTRTAQGKQMVGGRGDQPGFRSSVGRLGCSSAAPTRKQAAPAGHESRSPSPGPLPQAALQPCSHTCSLDSSAASSGETWR